MKLNKRQGEFLEDTIDQWEQEGTVSPETAQTLRGSYTVRPFDWKKLAVYSFWISIVCAIIAVVAALADRALITFVQGLFLSSDLALCVAAGVVAAALYALGLWQRRKKPERVLSNEAILFMGVLFTAVSIGYFGQTVSTGNGHYSVLFLISSVIYAVLALWFGSRLVWVFALLSVGAWFGTETGYISGWGAYYLGMNYPLRFVGFGAVLVLLAVVLGRVPRLSAFFGPTYVLGLLYLFIALWILSIFGNYGDMDAWTRAKQANLLPWGLLFGGVALAAILYGLKRDDATARGFGITFLFINLYTKYFEFFWDVTHKAVFFVILAISFGLVGRWAEKIWTLEFLRKNDDAPPKKNEEADPKP